MNESNSSKIAAIKARLAAANANKPKPSKPVSNHTSNVANAVKNNTSNNVASASKPVVKEQPVSKTIGNYAEPGTISAKDFLFCLIAFNNGAEFTTHIHQNDVHFNKACQILKSKLHDPSVEVQNLSNHQRVCMLIDAFRGYQIGMPRGFQLFIASDIARAIVNPDGGWVPDISKQILNENIVSRRDAVVKPDELCKKITDYSSRIYANIIAPDSEMHQCIKEGNKLGAAEAIASAIVYSLCMRDHGFKSEYSSIDPETYIDIAVNVCGFTYSQAAVIVDLAGKAAVDGKLKEVYLPQMETELSRLGPCPNPVKEKKKVERDKKDFGYSSTIGDLLASKGINISL